VNSLAENFLEVALKHRQSFEQSLKQTRLDRAEFAAQLRTLPGVSRVIEGGGNFVLVCGRFTNIVERLLQYANMLVKDVSPKIADGRYWLRIAVRLPHENQQLMEALRELL
jgi:histidinol-phosphate/aromatic aminotransferase/cobyric acid decarboxylase-like protein